MPKKTTSGLGRGFFDLYEDNLSSIQGGKNNQTMIRVADIEPRSDQPRKAFDHEALESLADSISQFGLIQPIVVRENPISAGTYEIIAGERRYRASKMAGLNEVPCIIMDSDELKTNQLAIIENVQRENLNPIEEATAYKTLIEGFGLSQEDLAKQVNKNRATIANMMRLLDLPEAVQQLLIDGKITAGHARALLPLSDEQMQIETANKIVENDLSVRAVEKAVKAWLEKKDEENEPEDDIADKKEAKMRKSFIRSIENKAKDVLGRKVRILQTKKKKVIEISFSDDEDLETAIRSICGEDMFQDLIK